jgi:hypothetical protein
MDLKHIINLEEYPLDQALVEKTREKLKKDSVVLLPNFLQLDVLQSLVKEAESIQDQAFCRRMNHSVYLKPSNQSLAPDHIFNRQVVTSKGCVTTDQIPCNSYLKELYYNLEFQQFLENVLGVEKLHDYQDPLSSITIHYGCEGQELGWHFDNSAFAITLLLQKPEAGGIFEYISNVREENSTHFGFNDEIRKECIQDVEQILDGEMHPKQLEFNAGTLVLFRGRDSLHRVSKVIENTKRILVVLAYNEVPNVRLPDETMMTFFGRTA